MKEIDRLLKIIDRLRGPDGCPWDRKQTSESLKPQLIDEAHEVLAAINSLDLVNLEEELGDLLFGILMLCRTAESEAGIKITDVARGIEEKIIRRHPHVFSEVKVDGVDDVVRNWEEIKAREKQKPPPDSLFDDTLLHLPALQRAQRIQNRARKAGFDWKEIEGVLDKIKEELAEVEEELGGGSRERLEAELGDLLFSVVNLTRFVDLSAEPALQKMINRWVRRFQKMEGRLKEEGRSVEDTSFEELDALWEEIADQEKRKQQ
jgi:MazG family protein